MRFQLVVAHTSFKEKALARVSLFNLTLIQVCYHVPHIIQEYRLTHIFQFSKMRLKYDYQFRTLEASIVYIGIGMALIIVFCCTFSCSWVIEEKMVVYELYVDASTVEVRSDGDQADCYVCFP